MKTLIQCWGMVKPSTLSWSRARTSVITAAPASEPMIVP